MPIDKKELLAALKDPAIRQWLNSLIIQNATVTGIGRFPGQGSAQNDNYVYPDAADVNFPYNFDYEIPGNFQRIISAKLSFKIRPYRTYSSLTLTATGNASNDHTHGMGHTHAHNHNIVIGATIATATLSWDGTNVNSNGTTGTYSNMSSDNTGSSAANTGGQSATHTHTVSGTTVLGISEDVAPVNPGITVKVDGTDVTATLGGPFNADMIEIDVSQVLKTSAKVWHVMSLQPNQRVRLTGILRISYLVDSRVAQ